MNSINRLTPENFVAELAARLVAARRSTDCRVACGRSAAQPSLTVIRRQAIEGYRFENIGWFILAGSVVLALALSF